MRSGNESNANKAYIFSSVGSLDGDSTDRRHAVRPALHSTAVNFLKKPRIFRAFETIVRSYDAWLRSGNNNNARNANLLNSNGGNNNNNTNNRYAVRPALHSSVKNFSADNSRIPSV